MLFFLDSGSFEHSQFIVIVSGTPTVAMASGFDWYRVISLNKCLSIRFCYLTYLPYLTYQTYIVACPTLGCCACLALWPWRLWEPHVCVGFLCVQISGLGSLLVVVVKVCDEGADKPRMVDRLCLACLQLLEIKWGKKVVLKSGLTIIIWCY